MQSEMTDIVVVAAPHFDVPRHAFFSFDGAELGLSAWTPPKGVKTWAVIVGLHGMDDYSQTFAYAGPWFAAHGVATFAYDARGFGRSPHRGFWPGEDLMTRDLHAALDAARRRYPEATLAVVGDSMGAATAIVAFGGPDPPHADRVILAAPAVWGWSMMPPLYSAVLWSGAHTLRSQRVSPPRDLHIMPSDNITMLRALARDPLIIRRTRIDAIYGLVDLMQTASEKIGAIRAPTAFLYGAHDQIIPRETALRAARRLPEGARTAYYERGYHMLLRDVGRERVYQDILSFLRAPEAPFPSGAPTFIPPAQSPSFQALR
jgi:alpha-beta hydrolase superfamily lysophospholipase